MDGAEGTRSHWTGRAPDEEGFARRRNPGIGRVAGSRADGRTDGWCGWPMAEPAGAATEDDDDTICQVCFECVRTPSF